MAGIDSRVDDVCASTGTCTVIRHIACAAFGAVRNPAETPRCPGLRDISIDAEDRVLLDVFNLTDVH